jgi:hypothetical protein
MRFSKRLILPIAVFGFLVVAADGDSFFRDEFYYLACARHLAWGYVDHPPFSIGVLWAIVHTAGDSLMVLRIAAAAAAAATVWLTGSIARRLGAGPFGERLAMIVTAIAPVLLANGSFYSMNVIEVLLWTAIARVVLDVVEAPSDRHWMVLGVLLGISLENKISALWLGAGIGAGLLVTSPRKLLTRGPWIAGAIAGVLFLPHIAWQVVNGWPTLEFIRNASRDKMQVTAPLAFIGGQIMNMHPLTLPVWVAGLTALLFARRFKTARILGVMFVTVAAIVMVNQTSRSGYLAPAYPMLFAAGAAWWESVLQARWLRVATIGVLVCGGLATAPLAVPILSNDRYVRYSAALGVAPGTEERNSVGRLPQFFADRQGWDRFVSSVETAWSRLSAEDRERAVVVALDYGQAGAIEHIAGARGLRAISAHNNYWFWGPGDAFGDVMIVLSRRPARLEQLFTQVTQIGVTACGDCMPYENHLPIFVCRGLKIPVATWWKGLKHFD